MNNLISYNIKVENEEQFLYTLTFFSFLNIDVFYSFHSQIHMKAMLIFVLNVININ